MITRNYYILTRKFLLLLASAIIWIVFPPGVYLAIEGHNEGIVLILLALFVVILAVDGRIFRKLEDRPIAGAQAYFMVLAMANSVVFVAVFAFTSASIFLSNRLVTSIYAVGTIMLFALSAWLLLNSKQKSH